MRHASKNSTLRSAGRRARAIDPHWIDSFPAAGDKLIALASQKITDQWVENNNLKIYRLCIKIFIDSNFFWC